MDQPRGEPFPPGRGEWAGLDERSEWGKPRPPCAASWCRLR